MSMIAGFADEMEKIAQSQLRSRITVRPTARVGGYADALPGYEMHLSGRRIGGIELKRKVDGTRQVAMSEIHGAPIAGKPRPHPGPALDATPAASADALKERIRERLATWKRAREGALVEPSFRGMGLGKKFYGDMLRREPGNAIESDRLLSLDSTRIYQSMQRRQAARAAAGLDPTYEVHQNPTAVVEDTGTSTSPYTGGAFKTKLHLPDHLAVPARPPPRLPPVGAPTARYRYQP